jgi:two-component system sensor histidine kinase ChiS
MAVDIDKIERIILNLLSNSTKFTDKGGSFFVNMSDLGEKIAISVRDTGIGIPQD